MTLKLRSVILTVLIGVGHVLFGQHNSGNNLTFSLGPSFPVGVFSIYDFQKKERGLAEPGFYINAAFNHNLKGKPYGYTAGLKFASFTRDGEVLIDSHVPEEGQYLFKIKMGKYNMADVHGGFFYDLLSKKKINVRILGSCRVK